MPVSAALPAAATPAVSRLQALRKSFGSRASGKGPHAAADAAASLGRFWDGSEGKALGLSAEADSKAPMEGRASGLSPPRAAPKLVERPLESLLELRVGTYNMLNLFEHVGKFEPDPARPGAMRQVTPAQLKAEWQLRESARAIRESAFDILVLQEIENIAALSRFNEDYLGGEYGPFLIEGNDSRGIDVAFLVKRDIPFALEQRTHKGETWDDPLLPGPPQRVFSRDLPVLIVRAPGRPAPLFLLFGTHFKSKRTRLPQDPESRILRRAQADRSAEIVGRYREEFGAGLPLLFAGDFNGEINREPEFEGLRRAAGLVDSFDALKTPVPPAERITHTYHPREGPTQARQIDAVMVSSSLKSFVRSAEVYRYKDAEGKAKPIPKTHAERSRNPSDHFPVLVVLDFPPILRAGR